MDIEPSKMISIYPIMILTSFNIIADSTYMKTSRPHYVSDADASFFMFKARASHIFEASPNSTKVQQALTASPTVIAFSRHVSAHDALLATRSRTVNDWPRNHSATAALILHCSAA